MSFSNVAFIVTFIERGQTSCVKLINICAYHQRAQTGTVGTRRHGYEGQERNAYIGHANHAIMEAKSRRGSIEENEIKIIDKLGLDLARKTQFQLRHASCVKTLTFCPCGCSV